MTFVRSRTRPVRTAAFAAFTRRARRFRNDEDGAIVAFTLFALIIMLIMGGIAIDVMRHEMERARLQNTLDTAVLAAVGAPYGSKPKDILQDYFAKAETRASLNEISDDDIVQTLNTSKLSASAQMTIDTHLMKLTGVKQLSAVAASTAERRVPMLEVSLVLDVSGSMDQNRRLINLKKAGKQFISSILNSSAQGDSVVSIIPFSWDVAPGPDIFAALNVDVRQNYSTCLRFDTSDFDATAIDPKVEQMQMIYTSRDDHGFDNLNRVWRSCYTDDYIEIMPYSISEAALHAKIDSLKAGGNTAGEMGMKWGAALLDPMFQGVKTALNTPDANNIKVVDDLVGDVPAAYDQPDTLKVIVMMGDGENTYSHQFPKNSQFRGPDSFLHRVTWQGQTFKYAYKINQRSRTSTYESYCRYSDWECVYESTTQSVYYLYNPLRNEYLNLENDTTIPAWQFSRLPSDLDGFLSREQLSWEMAWGMMSPGFLAKKFNYYTAKNEFEGSSNRVHGWMKDQRMSAICTAIKDKGVVVYTIGFEVPKGGHAEKELRACASSQAHYYRAEGISISDAFNSIALNVINLRLTQ